MRSRQATTLLELIIATALFSTLLVLVLEALMNMRGLAHTVEDIDILEEEAATAKREITRDFTNSGWFYCKPGANGRKFYPQIHLSDQKTWQLLPISPDPVVEIPELDSATKTFILKTYPASVTMNRASVLGDAIVFARLQPEGVPLSETPVQSFATIVDFRTASPVRMDAFANARPVQSLLMKYDPTAADQPLTTSVVWETTPRAMTEADGLTAGEMFSDANIRLFCYRVVPDPTTGRGQLIRYYSNPNSGNRNNDDAWKIDQVIANDVIGMRIYSSEMSSWYAGTESERDFSVNEAAGLTSNQIRFCLDLARNFTQIEGSGVPDQTRARSIKKLQFTIGMRSITNALDQ